MNYSDETLVAYMDGALDEADSKALEAAVEADPELERRLIALDTCTPVVRDVFESLPDDDRLAALTDLPAAQPVTTAPRSAPRLMLAAAVAGLAAFALTFWATRPGELSWQEQVAIYQALYVPDTIATLNTAPDALDAQFARAEARLGRSLEQAGLATLPGLELKRAQILAFDGAPLIQIAFADDAGRPIAFCIVQRSAPAPDRGVTRETLSGLATVHWADENFGYMLVGGDDPAGLESSVPVLTELFQS